MTYDATLARYESLFRTAAGRAPEPPPVRVVYHVAGLGHHWRQIVGEQLGQLAGAGLTRVFATHVGEGAGELAGIAAAAGVGLTIVSSSPDVTAYERPGIRLAHTLARTGDSPVLYLHSKGVSHPLSEPVWHEWRRLMMAELVAPWRAHVAALSRHDAVGVNWWADPKGHFSGNFWLASAAWLRSLPDPDAYYRDRYSCERWIGSRKGCRALSLVCRDRKFWSDDKAYLLALPRKPL